jgi:uncharacterized protein (TIGR02246 family)
MKKVLLSLAVMTFCALHAHAQSKSDAAAVRALPQAFVAAWNVHDGRQLAGIMAENVDFVNVGGDWMHGRSDFELYHTRLLTGVFKRSSLSVVDSAVSFLHPDTAVLHWTWSISGDGLEDPVTHQPRKGIFTMIAQKHGEEWLIVVAQNTDRSTRVNPDLKGIKPQISFSSVK